MDKMDKIIVFDCEDKDFQEKHNNNKLLKLPKSFRCILAGPPSTGKSCVIKNILVNASQFDVIYIHHVDPLSIEYKDVDYEPLDKIPHISELDPFYIERKNILLILEDLDYKELDRHQRYNLSRLYGVWSSHNGISIISTCQEIFNTSPIMRRLASHIFLFRSKDLNQINTISNRIGLSKKQIEKIFTNYIIDRHDFLLIDFNNPDEKFRYRKNFIDIIDLENL
jgi:hypothetical protein